MPPHRIRRLLWRFAGIAVLFALLMVVRWAFPAENNGDVCTARLPFPGTAFEGPVRHVGDGDSLCVDAGDGLIEVRLADFDAPELAQRGGAEARAALRRIALDRIARCRALYTSHDRIVARCAVDGQPLGQAMTDAGVYQGGN